MRAKLVVAYDGTGFRGFARNEGVRTVMAVLTEAIERVVRVPVDLTGAGRTDAGVHAWGQVVSGELPDTIDLDGLVRRLNKLCAPEIAVRSAEWIDDDFDARFSALWRHYRYEVWNAPTPNPLLGGRAWWVSHPLDVDAMNAACAPLLGEHDFSSFCRRVKVAADEPERTRVRRVTSASWTDRADDHHRGASAPAEVDGTPGWAEAPARLRFEIRANAFCHQMVRSIVGTLVDVGTGKFAADAMGAIIDARSREAAGQVAPPHGLTLWEVGYPTPQHEISTRKMTQK